MKVESSFKVQFFSVHALSSGLDACFGLHSSRGKRKKKETKARGPSYGVGRRKLRGV